MDIRKAQPIEHVVYWTNTQEGLEQAELSARSVQRALPSARLFLYTDRPDAAPWADVVERMDFSKYPLMVANLVAQTHYMLQYGNSPTAFLDTDILLVKRLHIDPTADLAVTFRDYVAKNEGGEKVEGVAKSMPYNYGVLMANPTLAAREAFLWMRDRVNRMHPQAKHWYGNQMALRELVGMERQRKVPYVTHRILPWAKVAVRVLDAEVWNYTPEKPDEPLTNRRVLHLKGGRKALMQHFLDRIEKEAA